MYHCRSCGFDLHPCCAKLPMVLDDGDVKLYLYRKVSASCHRCGRKGRSWSYRSTCKKYNLHQVEEHKRADVADSLYYEAYCRIKDPVYGCVGIITVLHEEIYHLQCQLAKVQAEIDLLKAQPPVQADQLGQVLIDFLANQNGVYSSSQSSFDPPFY
ncbi:hypothetical protein K7X08_008809 [Anisodus acutangulus]|uniref:LOB domain-containing protein n=1 Tax=Anisodus acutangulus TaxID=402998 RepID=A0A9Q1MYQ1_9SOLA|nr:hypothetical protein K7X08_008809 [Anisodus acutangulus]